MYIYILHIVYIYTYTYMDIDMYMYMSMYIYMYVYMYMSMYIYIYIMMYIYNIYICVFNSKWFSNFEITSHQHPLTIPPSPPSPPSPTFHCPSYWQFLDCQTPCPWHDTIFCPSKESKELTEAEGATMPLAILDHASIGWSILITVFTVILSQWIQYHSKIIQGWLTTMEECGRILAWYVTNCRSCDSCRNDRQALCITTEQVDLKLWKICERQKHASASKEGESSFVSLTSSTGELWVCLQKSLDFTLFCCFHPNMCW